MTCKSKLRRTVDLPVRKKLDNTIKGHHVVNRETDNHKQRGHLSSNNFPKEAHQMKRTQIMYLTGAIILIMAGDSLQIVVRDSSDETRWQEYQSQIFTSNIKRHSEGTFSSDLTRYLDRMKAKDFVQWLMNEKRFSNSKRNIGSNLRLSKIPPDVSFLW
ncbi:pro-glucagon-like [Aquarana catesbeiana]|uniref:pro-glucagon-like n=1 Tax=Aquarana catesbeiana TaxID=8400 RepID=UPI003CCA3EB2